MFSFIKKDLLIFWRDRKEVLISLLAPLVIIIALNFAFSDLLFGDNVDVSDIHVGLVLEDNESLGLERFEETVQAMDIAGTEKTAIIEQASALSPSELLAGLFNDPELSEWIHTQSLAADEAREKVENGDLDGLIKIPEGFTYDLLRHVMLNEPVETALVIQLEENTFESDTLQTIMDRYMHTLNFQFGISNVTAGERVDPVLPQGGKETVEGVKPVDITQYFTIAMVSLFTLFIASTVAVKTTMEKRERVFNRIILTNSNPFTYLMGKVVSTFSFAMFQLIIIFIVSQLLLDVFPEKSFEFWLGILVIITFFALSVAGLSAVFTSLVLKMENTDAANGLFNIVIMVLATFGGNFFPLEGFPTWMQRIGEWTPNGLTVSVFTEWLKFGDPSLLIAPSIKLSVFFILCLIIGISLFPRRGRS